ncbi:hypothetical protein PMAYCL1PPCAC_22714 [Pristionchus mayeri]|uniref:Uncharacterized protein n=1 Tax=Pristionchus mayeri TaxID=1317129 RepID=A0AAN5CXK2_9BILA|nr:hypothetical protein PMAYCL1PPCAC_22714 [Pristionchus mayeri]
MFKYQCKVLDYLKKDIPQAAKGRDIVVFIESHGCQTENSPEFCGDEKNECLICDTPWITLKEVVEKVREFKVPTLIVHLACRNGEKGSDYTPVPLKEYLSMPNHYVLMAVRAGCTVKDVQPINPPTQTVLWALKQSSSLEEVYTRLKGSCCFSDFSHKGHYFSDV